MKNCFLPFLLLASSWLSAQCFSGLEDNYCNTDIADTLTAFNPGGFFDGEGMSPEGVFFPSLLSPGTYTISYTNTNYYDVDTTGEFDPVEGEGIELNLIDDGFSEAIEFGFYFEFFGSLKSFFRIHSNGFITFNFDPAIFPPYANVIPYPGMPTDLIAASWGDYDPTSGGKIEYFSNGTAPFRKMIVNYIDLPPYGGGPGNLTTQVIMYETTNVIEIHTTASPDYGSNKSMGIENGDGTIGFVRPGRNKEIWEAFNDYVAFIPEYCADTTEVLDCTISIAEVLNSEGISIYPNPADQLLNIHITDPGQFKNLRLLVCDLTGATLYAQGIANDRSSIPLNSLGAGYYYIRIYSESGFVSLPFTIIR